VTFPKDCSPPHSTPLSTPLVRDFVPNIFHPCFLIGFDQWNLLPLPNVFFFFLPSKITQSLPFLRYWCSCPTPIPNSICDPFFSLFFVEGLFPAPIFFVSVPPLPQIRSYFLISNPPFFFFRYLPSKSFLLLILSTVPPLNQSDRKSHFYVVRTSLVNKTSNRDAVLYPQPKISAFEFLSFISYYPRIFPPPGTQCPCISNP